ncbi:thymocyte selection-associated high mobility group box protein TOX-like isoform X1 [Oncorhynchus tshawytscha]|uniref:HMG box domain-containing protein n=1 Tax=Oncorhynchus tshawytscha TaxID=74940 RepID=A0AAZ3R8V6_ONCTS|nr:thymocyte selection-associated high mobility group box protein TOX-like isoform X1 [Oncorhynchus tshawytscha]
MDVRVYPPPPQSLPATDSSRLGPLQYPDSPYCNKYNSETMFLGMPEAGLDFVPTNQFRVPPNPHQTQTSAKQTGPLWKREGPAHSDGPRLPWSYPVPSLGDEDFNIPPITPPTIPEHMLHPHLPESESGSYHPLAPSHSQSGLHPFHLQGMDMMGQDGGLLSQNGGLMSSTLSVMQQMVNSDSRYSSHQPMEALRPRSQSGMGHQSQLTTINQSQLNAQLGLSGNNITHNSPSPPGSKSATPSPSSSVHEDDNEESIKAEKRPAAVETPKKPKTPKKKKKKDPNEPSKPVSAYALFFRDTQAAIKGSNPNATFGEVSKIVASMWDGLGEEQKQVYKKKTETAKKEYLKQLAAYRASLVSQSYNEPGEVKVSQASSMLGPKPPVFPGSGHQHPQQHPHPHHSHPSLYMSHPYHHQSHHPHPHHQQQQSQQHQAGLSPHLSPLQGLSRGVTPRPSGPHSGGVSLGSMAAVSPPPFQISPPLHSHSHLGMHHQQQLGGHPLSLHSPSMGQGFPLQSDFQNMLNSSGGQGLSPSMDYRQVCRNGPSQHLDWTSEYCGNGALQRDKPLFLT